MVKRIFALLLTLLLICGLAVTATASHPVPDLTQQGSITFRMDWDGQKLDSGALNLYKVGEIMENNGNYSFRLVEALGSAVLTREQVNDPILAEELLTLAKERNLVKLSSQIAEGTCVFEPLDAALYLVWQDGED